MKLIDNIPTWEHDDFVMRSPTINYRIDNTTISWAIVDKDTDVPVYFEITFSMDELTRYCQLFENPAGLIITKIINESVSYITNYVDTHDFENIKYEHFMDHIEFRSKLRFEVHTWFVHDNINILKSFEEMIKEKVK